MRTAIRRASAALLLLLALAPLPGPTGEVRAGTALRLDVAGLVERSGEIFEGRVLSTRVLSEPDGRLETEVVVGVSRTWWGAPRAAQVFRVPGGLRPDGSGLVLPGLPGFEPGEELLLFLTEPSSARPAGAPLRLPVGLAQGKLRLLRTAAGTRSLTRDLDGLSLVDGAGPGAASAAAAGAVRYEDFVRALELAVARRRSAAPDEER
jgi:hypothetical protein